MEQVVLNVKDTLEKTPFIHSISLGGGAGGSSGTPLRQNNPTVPLHFP